MVTPPEGRERGKIPHGGVLSALGHRDYTLVWAGALISNIGTWIQSTALLWHVKETTNSNVWVGAVNMAYFIPILFFVLFAGHVADVYQRKRVLYVTYGVMMVSALALGVAQSFGAASLPLIMVTVFVSGTAYAFSAPAGVSLLPCLVPEEDMMNALALGSAQFNIGRVIGPALGAVIVAAWSVAGAFYINALSYIFILTAIAIARLRTVEVKRPRGDVFKSFSRAYLRRSSRFGAKGG